MNNKLTEQQKQLFLLASQLFDLRFQIAWLTSHVNRYLIDNLIINPCYD